MPFAVFLTDDAAPDLDEIYDYIALHDAPQKADYVLKPFEKIFSGLSKSAERGGLSEGIAVAGDSGIPRGNL